MHRSRVPLSPAFEATAGAGRHARGDVDFVLDEVTSGVTRLVVRARGGPGYRFRGLPLLLTRIAVRLVHFIMQRKQLLGIARRAERQPPSVAVETLTTSTGRNRRLVIANDASASSRGGHLVQTSCGAIEYSEEGKGKTVLSIHGAGGGWDQGLLISPFVGEGFRVIAPSRFGYLATPYPNDRSAMAQADAYACLLDSLGIERVSVVAFSAGGPSALQFAIRYPERTATLVMVSAISDASLVDPRPVDPSKDPVLSVMLTDFVFWAATTYFSERALAFFGVSRAAQQRLTTEEHDRALRVLRMILPMSMRKTGNFNDPAHWFERGEFALERITAPTLVIHAIDDNFVPFAHGQYTAARIPNARSATQEFGGHFVYVRDAVLGEIRAFIDQ